MEIENTKFKKGDKVVPINKSIYVSLSDCSYWKHAQERNQNYLYVIDIIKNFDGKLAYILSDDCLAQFGGNSYLECDLMPYTEPRNYTIVANNLKFIFNGPATICIKDGVYKGIAMCNPSDEFNEAFGKELAYIRAQIDQYQKLEKDFIKQATKKKELRRSINE